MHTWLQHVGRTGSTRVFRGAWTDPEERTDSKEGSFREVRGGCGGRRSVPWSTGTANGSSGAALHAGAPGFCRGPSPECAAGRPRLCQGSGRVLHGPHGTAATVNPCAGRRLPTLWPRFHPCPLRCCSTRSFPGPLLFAAPSHARVISVFASGQTPSPPTHPHTHTYTHARTHGLHT